MMQRGSARSPSLSLLPKIGTAPITARRKTVVNAAASEKELQAKVTDKVFFDIEIGGEAAGRVVIGLYGEVVPKTSLNFKLLCAGTEGYSFKNCIFHRVIPQFMIQSGDMTDGDGTGKTTQHYWYPISAGLT